MLEADSASPLNLDKDEYIAVKSSSTVLCVPLAVLIVESASVIGNIYLLFLSYTIVPIMLIV
jgi:hypothetical protein